MNFATQTPSPWTTLVREGVTSHDTVLRVQAESHTAPEVVLYSAHRGVGLHVRLTPAEAMALGAELMQAAMAAHPKMKEAAA